MIRLQRYKYFLCTALSLIMAMSVRAQSTVSISSSSGHPGDEVELSVSLSDAQSATALQIRIPHSPYLSYKDNSAVLNAQLVSSSHSLSVSDTDNMLEFYVYDMSLNTFKEGTGILLTFRLKLGKEPGIYALKPEVVLSDPSSKALPVNVKAGEVKVLSPKIALSEKEVDYGSVPIRSKHTKEISVSNTGNETLNISDVKSESALFKVSPTSMSIAAGQKNTLTIEYNPQNYGSDNTDITIVSDASNGNQVIHVSASPFSVNTLSVSGASGQAGEEVTVRVSMQNMEPIVGMQCSFTLPEVLRYVDGSVAFSSRVKNDSHNISGTVQGDRLSFFIHSASNAPLPGSEGELFTFKLLLNGTGGDYQLNPEDVLLSNADGRDMTSDVTGANIRIAAPKLECADELDFGRIPIEEIVKKRFSITNSGESPLVIQRIEFSNESFSLTEPAKLPTIAAGKSSDIEICYRTSGEETFTGVMQIYSNDPQNRMQTVDIKGTVFIFNELELKGEAIGGNPDKYTLTVSLQNSLPIVGMQFDIHWIPGMTPDKESISFSDRASGHKAEITKLTDDSYRVYIYSMNNASIVKGDGPVVSIIYNKVNGEVDYDQTTVLADQIILSTADGRNCASSVTAAWTIGNMSGLLGDANNDGQVNIQDVICISRYILGEIDSSGIVESLADYNQDHVINEEDLIGVLNAIFGINKQ